MKTLPPKTTNSKTMIMGNIHDLGLAILSFA
jgi:hypothetical protein